MSLCLRDRQPERTSTSPDPDCRVPGIAAAQHDVIAMIGTLARDENEASRAGPGGPARRLLSFVPSGSEAQHGRVADESGNARACDQSSGPQACGLNLAVARRRSGTVDSSTAWSSGFRRGRDRKFGSGLSPAEARQSRCVLWFRETAARRFGLRWTKARAARACFRWICTSSRSWHGRLRSSGEGFSYSLDLAVLMLEQPCEDLLKRPLAVTESKAVLGRDAVELLVGELGD